MPIKTTGTGANRRIITKLIDGQCRVSCSCCSTVCRPYPADQLGVGYTEDDLPDTIDVLVNISTTADQRFLMSRNGSEYGPVETTFTIGATTITYDPYVIVETFVGELNWFFLSIQQGGGGESLSSISPYLFDEFSSSEDIPNIINDVFEDTYTVSGPVSGTVTRQSRCVWTGAGLTLSNYDYQWRVNGRNKSGFQNTPVGSYADGYSVS